MYGTERYNFFLNDGSFFLQVVQYEKGIAENT